MSSSERSRGCHGDVITGSIQWGSPLLIKRVGLFITIIGWLREEVDHGDAPIWHPSHAQVKLKSRPVTLGSAFAGLLASGWLK